jgi:hypothetical protein
MVDSSECDKEVEALLDTMRRRYGDRLATEELEEMREVFEGIIKCQESLRAVRLENRDEPLTTFTPYRGEV